MALCNACDRLARTLSTYSGNRIDDMQHLEAANLLESAKNCRLCKFLISCIGSSVYTSVGTYGFLTSTVKEDLTLNSECGRRLTYTITGIAPYRCHFYITHENDKSNYSNGFDVVFWAEAGSPASNSGFMRLNSPIMDPNSTIRLIASWLEDCRSHHEECTCTISGGVISEFDDPALPTRVLDLGKDTSLYIRLLETNGMHGQYCALSHCWGRADKRPIKTTRYTLRDHVRGIEFKDLPKTFQDAVTVTRGIGIRYLWIDSLCIVQDDKDE